ncbi:MAG: type II toxin-antitoxin system HicA family toxin [Chloroflexota bacterium]
MLGRWRRGGLAVSPRLPRITGADLVRALERAGWRELRRRGSHVILCHPIKKNRPVVPVHAGAVLPPGTLSGILKDCELTPGELRELL